MISFGASGTYFLITKRNIHKEANRQTDRQREGKSDKQTGKETDTDRRRDRQTNKPKVEKKQLFNSRSNSTMKDLCHTVLILGPQMFSLPMSKTVKSGKNKQTNKQNKQREKEKKN